MTTTIPLPCADAFRNRGLVQVDEASPDAEFILEPEEYDLEWALVELSAASLALICGTDLESFISNSCMPLEVEDERSRCDGIETWMRSCGGAAAALEACPPLFKQDAGEMVLLDGSHRIAVAIHRFGLRVIPVVVGGLAPLSSDAFTVQDVPSPRF